MDEQQQPGQPGGNRNAVTFVAIAVIIVAAIAAYALARRKPPQTTQNSNQNQSAAPQAPAEASPQPAPAIAPPPAASVPPPAGSGAIVSSVKTFNITAQNFSFSPNSLGGVNQGDTVKIIFHSNGGSHSWVLDDFSARTPVVASGETATVQFVAAKAGTFQFYCSVDGHRAMGMTGTLVVQ